MAPNAKNSPDAKAGATAGNWSVGLSVQADIQSKHKSPLRINPPPVPRPPLKRNWKTTEVRKPVLGLLYWPLEQGGPEVAAPLLPDLPTRRSAELSGRRETPTRHDVFGGCAC